jgi:hypothetical protein
MKCCFCAVACAAWVGLSANAALSADVEFELLPGSRTGLKPAMEQWYDLEMKRQGGPGKQSHGWWPWGIRVLDYDRDGALDILASHHGVPRSIILQSHFMRDGSLQFSNGTEKLGLDNRDLPGADDRPWIWDFDGDGWLDIAGFSDESPPPSAWNDAGKKFTATSKPFFSPIAHPKEVLDLNGDGYLDLDGGAKGQWFYVPKSRTFRHDATSRFDKPKGVPAGLGETLEAHKKSNRFFTLEFWTHAPIGYDTLGYAPYPIDFDGDGRGDVVIHGSGGYGAVYLGRYLFGNADGSLTDRTKERGLPESGAPIMIEDLTGDGLPEVLVAGEKDSGLYLNDGAGRFTRVAGKMTDFLVRRGPYVLRAYRVDFNNDGRPDLVLSNPRLGSAAVFQNEGKGSFKSILSLSGCWDSNPIAIADIDNDGRMDLVVGGSTGADAKKDVAIYRNTTKSPGHYLKVEPRMPAPNPYAVGAVVEVLGPGELEKGNARPILVEKAHADATPIHVGLGERSTCDLRITFPRGKVVTARGVAADRIVTIDSVSGKLTDRQ